MTPRAPVVCAGLEDSPGIVSEVISDGDGGVRLDAARAGEIVHVLEFVLPNFPNDVAGWDRAHLECASPHGPDWWHNRP